VSQLEDRIASLERRLRIGKAVVTLKASAGWDEFVKHVVAEREHWIEKALDADEKNRDYVAGYCNGLVSIADLMMSVEEQVSRIQSELQRLSGGDVNKDPIGGIR
jgi:chorismate mutase